MLKPNHIIKNESSRGAGAAEESNGIDVGPLDDMLGYVLRRAQLAVFKNFKAAFAQVSITPAQYSVLLMIERNPGLKQTQVSDALGIKRANFVALIDALERRGLAERAPAADRRSYALYLTPEGRKFFKTLNERAEMHEAKIAAALTPEQRQAVLTSLQAIISSLSTLDEPAIDDEF